MHGLSPGDLVSESLHRDDGAHTPWGGRGFGRCVWEGVRGGISMCRL